jgi:cytohesin
MMLKRLSSLPGDELSPVSRESAVNLPEEGNSDYALCDASQLIVYNEDELNSIYNEAVVKFNIKPKSVREFLVQKRVIRGFPKEIAEFISTQPKLSKRRVGEYIGNVDEFNQKVCEELFAKYDFSGKPLDQALRFLMLQFRLPGEAQQIDRLLEKFAISYHSQNPCVYLSSDTAYVLSFSIIMLNTDLHNQSITPDKKMTLDQFIRNNRGINQGQDVPREVLEELYRSVQQDEIRMEETDMYESEVVAFMAPTKSGWLHKKSESLLGLWKRHWFVLNDGCLYYFNQPSDEGPRCIIPLDNTRIGRGNGDLDFIIGSASGDFVKSSKVLEDGRMEQGKHTQFSLRAVSHDDRESWVTTLQEESLRFKPLHEIFLRRREQERSQKEAPLAIPVPHAEGWMRKRGGINTSWKRRYFVLYPDFDGGGSTLFYYVSYQVLSYYTITVILRVHLIYIV